MCEPTIVTPPDPPFRRKDPRHIHSEHAANATLWRSQGIVWLHDVRSAHNVGSAFRTADAMGLRAVYLSGHTPHPPHPAISKTALGAEESVSWLKLDDPVHAVQELRREGYCIIALEQVQNAVSLDAYEPSSAKWCLMAGSEVLGLDQNMIGLCDAAVQIDQFGDKHSLNVAVAIGIAAFVIDSPFRSPCMRAAGL